MSFSWINLYAVRHHCKKLIRCAWVCLIYAQFMQTIEMLLVLFGMTAFCLSVCFAVWWQSIFWCCKVRDSHTNSLHKAIHIYCFLHAISLYVRIDYLWDQSINAWSLFCSLKFEATPTLELHFNRIFSVKPCRVTDKTPFSRPYLQAGWGGVVQG